MSTTVTVKTVQTWAEELEQVHRRLAPRFVRREPRQRVRAYLAGLLSPIERKNGWQRMLSGSYWDPDAERDDLRRFSSSIWAIASAAVPSSSSSSRWRRSQCPASCQSRNYL